MPALVHSRAARVSADVLGALAGFVRDGHEFAVTDPAYRLYVLLWCALYPLRFAAYHIRRRVRRLMKRQAEHG